MHSEKLPALVSLQQDVMSERMAQQLKMVLPAHVSVEKFQRVVITAVNKNPDLVDADRLSLLNSCVECATDGLLPNGKEAALVVYNTKVKERGQPDRWEKRAQYMPMIAGIYKRARNSGDVKMLNGHLVYENDQFDYEYGFEPSLVHKPAKQDRGEVIGVYAVTILADGTRDLEYMTKAEVEEARDVSRAKEDGPWKKWWGEMAKKTVVRRLAKRLSLSADLERMVQRQDDMYDFDDEPLQISGPVPPRPTRGSPDEAERIKAEQEADEPKDFCIADHVGEIVHDEIGPREFTEKMTVMYRNYMGWKDAKAFDQFFANNSDMIAALEKENFPDHAHGLRTDADTIAKHLNQKSEAPTPQSEASEGAVEEPAEADSEISGNSDASAAPEPPSEAQESPSEEPQDAQEAGEADQSPDETPNPTAASQEAAPEAQNGGENSDGGGEVTNSDGDGERPDPPNKIIWWDAQGKQKHYDTVTEWKNTILEGIKSDKVTKKALENAKLKNSSLFGFLMAVGGEHEKAAQEVMDAIDNRLMEVKK